MLTKILMGIFVLLVIVGSSFAGGGLAYVNSGNDWTTAANWENGVPTSSDWCLITYAGTYGAGPSVNAGDAAVGGNVVLGWGGWGTGISNLTITGGSLNIANDVWIGKDDSHTYHNAPGVLSVSGGSMTVGGYFVVGAGGSGTVNQTGGTVNTNIFVLDWVDIPMYADKGVYNLYGGNLNIASINFKSGGFMDIEEGIMTIDGDFRWYIDNLKDSHQITAYGGNGTLVYDFGVTNPGKTTVTAVVPEPCTLVLLGTGLMSLISRKRRA